MSITYNTGVPSATGNPSAEQPDMLINTNSVNQWVGIDHVVFANTKAGKHNKSTYVAQTSPPTVVAGEVAFFSQTSGGVTNVFYKHDADPTSYQLTGGTPSATTSGYSYLPGGIIMQWVQRTATGAFSWPTPFPTAVFGATLGYNDAVSGTVPNLTALTTAGATLNNSSTATVFIMAVGN